jgi:hypothetical protein
MVAVPPVPTDRVLALPSSTLPPVPVPTAVALPAPTTKLVPVVATLLLSVKSPAVVLMATAPVEETPL